MDTFTCPTHGIELEKKVGVECPPCVLEMDGPLPESVAARLQEIARWRGLLTVTFGRLHRRMEGLIGRPVWTHEFADMDQLCAEVRSGSTPSMGEIIEKLPSDNPVIVVKET